MDSETKSMIVCRHEGCNKLIPDPTVLGEGEEGKRRECGACRGRIYRRRKKELALAASSGSGSVSEELALLKIAHMDLQKAKEAKDAEISLLVLKNEGLEEKLATLQLE